MQPVWQQFLLLADYKRNLHMKTSQEDEHSQARNLPLCNTVLVIALIVTALTTMLAPRHAIAQNSPAAPQTGTAEKSSTSNIALLYVYRQHRYEGAALAPSIYVDDKAVARVGNGRRVTIKLTAGKHTIRSDDKSSAISLDSKAGQDYYVRIDEATGFWKGHGRLTLVLSEQGAAEFKLEKPIETDRIAAKEMVAEE